MFTLFVSLLFSVPASFQTRAALQAEILVLRHQLLVLQRSNSGHHVRLHGTDRLFWVWLSRLWTDWQSALIIVKPETVMSWHRQGFRLNWRWKSRQRECRPSVAGEVRNLIRRMNLANPWWGAPRIHGELMKLGIQVPQNWRTFLENHTNTLVSADFFVVPTITFRLLFVFVILSHDPRRPIHFAVTTNPTAEWTARQLLEAFLRDTAPRYLPRDRDGIYGEKFNEAANWLGIREVLTALRSPWQNPYDERLIGSTRREWLDHVITFSEAGLRRVLKSYFEYYERTRTHISLEKVRADSHTHFLGKRCADPSEGTASGTWRGRGATRSWRTPPPIRTPRGLAYLNFCSLRSEPDEGLRLVVTE